MSTPPITYKTLTLHAQPNRRAEFWSEDELLVVIHYNELSQGQTVSLLAIHWLSAAPGNCVNICS